MLKNIDPILGPELLKILRAMGHGDEIAIVDANYPASTDAALLVRMDGVSATRTLQGVISVLPLDTYVDYPVHTMQVVGDPDLKPEIVTDFEDTISSANTNYSYKFNTLERFEFYDRVKNAFAVVATGERRLYGNIILTKGVIEES